jgi:hypothetical protein
MSTQNELPVVVLEDKWGIVIDHARLDLLETRWYDTTAELTRDEFNGWLATFVQHLEQLGRSLVLVDATAFRMSPDQMDVEWRDQEIIPRYEKVGVRRFAFQMPQGMPAIGTPPRPEGPATFPTGYFGTRTDALAWLTA